MDFKQAEKRFKQLKGQFEAGLLTETEFKNQLEQLMIRDEQGSWWMIGYETGLWYRHDGTNWVQIDLSSSPSQKSVSIPNWVLIFWIMLGWASGFAIGTAIGYAIGTDTDIDWVIGLLSGAAISGTIGGFSIATTLRVQNTLPDWKSMFWITLAWAIGSVIGWAISIVAIGWTIGGLITATTLRAQNTLSNWRSILWITLAWAIGSAISAAITTAISDAIVGYIGWVIGWTVGGALGGAIGGFVMIWQIRENKAK